MRRSAAKLGGEVIDTQVAKALQLFNTVRAHHGIMLVGECGGGKSTILSMLADTISDPDNQDKALTV